MPRPVVRALIVGGLSAGGVLGYFYYSENKTISLNTDSALKSLNRELQSIPSKYAEKFQEADKRLKELEEKTAMRKKLFGERIRRFEEGIKEGKEMKELCAVLDDDLRAMEKLAQTAAKEIQKDKSVAEYQRKAQGIHKFILAGHKLLLAPESVTTYQEFTEILDKLNRVNDRDALLQHVRDSCSKVSDTQFKSAGEIDRAYKNLIQKAVLAANPTKEPPTDHLLSTYNHERNLMERLVYTQDVIEAANSGRVLIQGTASQLTSNAEGRDAVQGLSDWTRGAQSYLLLKQNVGIVHAHLLASATQVL